MQIDNSAWQELTKEQRTARKEEWKCISKSIKLIPDRFYKTSYITVHKKLFMEGVLDDKVLADLAANFESGGERFAHSLGFFLAWYYPSNRPEDLEPIVFQFASCGNGISKNLRDLLCQWVNSERTCPSYGFAGPKTELLINLFIRCMPHVSTFEIDGKEWEYGLVPGTIIQNFENLSQVLSGRRKPNKYEPRCTLERFLSDAFEFMVDRESESVQHLIKKLSRTFEAALNLYQERPELCENENLRYVRFRMLNRWFERKYSPRLLAFIDEVAERIGYEESWEDGKLKYNDEFIVPEFSIRHSFKYA